MDSFFNTEITEETTEGPPLTLCISVLKKNSIQRHLAIYTIPFLFVSSLHQTMPLNLQTFKTRALSAIVFVIIMLAGLGWNQWSFLVLFSIIHFGCWIEYKKIVGRIDPAYQKINAGHEIGVMLLGWGFMLWMTGTEFSISKTPIAEWGISLMVATALIWIISMFVNRKNESLKLAAHSIMGLVYISLSLGLMMRLWGNSNQTIFTLHNSAMPAVLIVSIWINDTMAYIVGSFIGKTPFSSISPKKTWEGTIGGAILAVVTVTLVGHFVLHYNVKALILISATAAIAGTVGDLYESKLKRLAGIKDSGNIMPGHGGFLDRFDSLLVATTATWVIFWLSYR